MIVSSFLLDELRSWPRWPWYPLLSNPPVEPTMLVKRWGVTVSQASLADTQTQDQTGSNRLGLNHWCLQTRAWLMLHKNYTLESILKDICCLSIVLVVEVDYD